MIYCNQYLVNSCNIIFLKIFHICKYAFLCLLTGSYLQFRHVVHIGSSLRLRGRIRSGCFVLQLAKSILHRRQGIHNEGERSGLTLRLLSTPSLALVQWQISHAVISGAAIIVVGEFLECCPSWNMETIFYIKQLYLIPLSKKVHRLQIIIQRISQIVLDISIDTTCLYQLAAQFLFSIAFKANLKLCFC